MRGVQEPSRSQITTPTGSIPNAYTDTSVFRTRSGGPLYKHHSHDSRVPLVILLLKKNEAEYIIIIHLSVIFRL